MNWLIHFFIRKSDSLPFCAGLMMTCSGIKKVDVSLFKVTNWNNRTMSKICSKLKTPQHLHLHRSGAPGVNFKHIPHIWLWASKYWLGNIRLPIKIFFIKSGNSCMKEFKWEKALSVLASKKKRLMPGGLRSINLLEGLIKTIENRYN